jgi:uncharacterized protein
MMDLLVAFAEALREAGVAASADRTSVAAEALGHWGVATGADPYWPLRVAFCSSEADLRRFDAVYRIWFRRSPPDDAGRSDPVTVRSRVGGDEAGTGVPADDAGGGAGDTAQLSTRDFDDLTEEELREVSAWVEMLRPVPLRRAMRHRPARSGRIDPARTMRLMLRNGGEVLRVRHRRRVPRPRRVLLLVDVSASMRPYSDVLLRFAHAALHANPRTTEVFAVGTRPTRLTGPLSARRPEVALPAAGRVRTDWSGGTTLGVALRDFLRRWGGSAAVRSAIVVLASDGFEFREPTLMVAQVARLAGLARVLIWVDPSRRRDGDRPVDDHVARAQAHATAVLGCHNYEALRELAKVITNA